MKVVSVVGARPQFIKAAPVSRAFRAAGHREVLVHTGQHYDERMSEIFFSELEIPAADYNLGVGSGSHGLQTGRMLMLLEEVLAGESPDWVLVYGDTNSTLAAALAAVKLQIPLAHLEAGLRSYNRAMPEEHNRVLTDHCSDMLLCPTRTAVDNLAREGITRAVHLVGDTMYDALLQHSQVAGQLSNILDREGLLSKGYLLATVHRPYNTENPEALRDIVLALEEIGDLVIFPVHPRTRKRISELDGLAALATSLSHVRMIEPVGYLDMLTLEQNARLILTDSGGMQKEAYFFGVPCITLRPETEWVETVETGRNVLVGANRRRIVEAASVDYGSHTGSPPLFGDGRASYSVVRLLEDGGPIVGHESDDRTSMRMVRVS
ncbi:MAG TPA: UDP-N-acetylglucosamine 2-epimerase (non-hydrolyzing) [Chloroflexota bacterium]|nr:UDP-N-acetylglucosamine 2-epimerase (non-hydrolyzing) [Chloroflexota bacterium]